MAQVMDVYEVIIKEEYYGTVMVPTGSDMSAVQTRIDELFPLLKNRKNGKDYDVKFIMSSLNDNY